MRLRIEGYRITKSPYIQISITDRLYLTFAPMAELSHEKSYRYISADNFRVYSIDWLWFGFLISWRSKKAEEEFNIMCQKEV